MGEEDWKRFRDLCHRKRLSYREGFDRLMNMLAREEARGLLIVAMRARLALVIYWIGCALAGLFVVLAIVLYFIAKSSAGTFALSSLSLPP